MKNKRTCDYIAEAIQNEILSGRMEAGQPLRQEELSEKLVYSRMPVREALQILEEQGLVRRLATRHVVVADFSRRNIEEIFDMVGNVEKKALKDLAEMSFEWVYSAEGVLTGAAVAVFPCAGCAAAVFSADFSAGF